MQAGLYHFYVPNCIQYGVTNEAEGCTKNGRPMLVSLSSHTYRMPPAISFPQFCLFLPLSFIPLFIHCELQYGIHHFCSV